jgi:hypothetical protein
MYKRDRRRAATCGWFQGVPFVVVSPSRVRPRRDLALAAECLALRA